MAQGGGAHGVVDPFEPVLRQRALEQRVVQDVRREKARIQQVVDGRVAGRRGAARAT
jgi:hypothetical protein